ncbi:recombinase RecA [Candidatus Parcubacteria bacterium]|nr:MAG: recombinase RecA [Candidatus Parcubacteria bacterium]
MPKEEKAEKLRALEDTVKELQDKFGEGALMMLGEARKVNVDVIPTGSLALDMALGVGGMPRGRVVEIFGPESSGKTTLALHIVAQAQKKGGLAAFVDAEHALDPDYAKRLGVKVNELLISQPDTGEQALEIVDSLVRSGSMDVVVIDSVAALTPRAEIEGDMGQQHVGLQARLMSHALRKLTGSVSRTKTVVIFINQIRMQIGIMFGNPETTPGGKALKFYSSVRVEVRRAAQIKKGDEIIGNRVNAKVVKNKVAAPFRRAEFDIFYNEGISHEAELLILGEKYGVLKKSGASYLFGGTRLGQGFDNARNFLKENGKIADEIAKKIKDAAASGVVPEPKGKGKEED